MEIPELAFLVSISVDPSPRSHGNNKSVPSLCFATLKPGKGWIPLPQ